MMKSQYVCWMVVVATVFAPGVAAAQALEVDGVMGLYPVEENSCIAVEIDAAMPVASLSWYHNDGTTAFPKLLLVEGEPGAPPDLGDPGLILDSITGESLSWGTVTLSTPVSSSTGTAYAVFFFPPYEERTGEGTGGGPGLGYRHEPSDHATYLSRDGVEWVALHGDFAMAMEVVTGAMKGLRAQVLSELDTSIELAAPATKSPARPVETVLHNPFPNPFNPSVEIRFDLASATEVSVRVYDARGRQVRTLVAGPRGVGPHSVTWNGEDDRGQRVASGVYYARLVAGEFRQEKTMTLVQ